MKSSHNGHALAVWRVVGIWNLVKGVLLMYEGSKIKHDVFG